MDWRRRGIVYGRCSRDAEDVSSRGWEACCHRDDGSSAGEVKVLEGTQIGWTEGRTVCQTPRVRWAMAISGWRFGREDGSKDGDE